MYKRDVQMGNLSLCMQAGQQRRCQITMMTRTCTLGMRTRPSVQQSVRSTA